MPKRSEVVISPAVVDGTVARLVELPDGSGRVETWEPDAGAWVVGGANAGEVGTAPPASPETLRRLGVPRPDWV